MGILFHLDLLITRAAVTILLITVAYILLNRLISRYWTSAKRRLPKISGSNRQQRRAERSGIRRKLKKR